ncbi:TIGR00159 family protein [Oscillospiraceae bacterium DSM 107454]|uniref:Diadenylate cyclase n=2 Tax=Ructibacterium gallinarum TaxID=2779355 RepID=A0A9D5M6I1_9FIRM|nr:TIGR00159 family protein [Ructibacterium gallinarum]
MWWENFYHAALNQLALFRITDVIDILAVSYLVYKALKFIRETRTMRLLKGVVLLIVITQLSYFFQLNTLYYILSNVLQLGLIALLIVFQPELRRVLEHVGRTSMGKWFNSKGEFDAEAMQMIREVSKGAQAMANSHTGALIVIENEDNIDTLISSGIKVHAETTSELLENIFVPNTPLHDGAVVIRDNKVELATCVLPLSQNPNIRQELGTRHRAGIGISEESDAVVIIVSEETGKISIAYKGVLDTGYHEDSLRDRIIELLNSSGLTQNTSEGKFSLKNLTKRGKEE